MTDHNNAAPQRRPHGVRRTEANATSAAEAAAAAAAAGRDYLTGDWQMDWSRGDEACLASLKHKLWAGVEPLSAGRIERGVVLGAMYAVARRPGEASPSVREFTETLWELAQEAHVGLLIRAMKTWFLQLGTGAAVRASSQAQHFLSRAPLSIVADLYISLGHDHLDGLCAAVWEGRTADLMRHQKVCECRLLVLVHAGEFDEARIFRAAVPLPLVCFDIKPILALWGRTKKPAWEFWRKEFMATESMSKKRRRGGGSESDDCDDS